MIFIVNFKQLDTNFMNKEKYSLYLNEVRKNLTAKVDRSPLIGEPLNKSYGDHWLLARFGIKARLCRHAVACQEVATLSQNRAESPVGRSLKHASAALQPSPRAKAITFGPRLAATCFGDRRDPIGLIQRFLCYGYASAGDRLTLFAIFPLSFVPFMQYAGSSLPLTCNIPAIIRRC